MRTNTYRISVLLSLLFIGGLGSAFAQTFDISSGGAPTITGSLGGSVTGSSSVASNLSVSIDFGELSPANPNNIVKVIVPITIRSSAAYRVTVSLTGSAGTNIQGIQASDVGFGARNLRTTGNRSQVCNNSSHIFYSPFNNDPASSVSLNAAGRVQYPSALDDIGTSTTILSGPVLTQGAVNRATNNGYIFDAIFAVTPQFYAASSGNATITFTISAGPSAPC